MLYIIGGISWRSLNALEFSFGAHMEAHHWLDGLRCSCQISRLRETETACCQSTQQATVAICVCQHSPHDQMVKRVKRVPEMVETLRQVGNRTDTRVQLGEQQTECQKMRVFKTDIWRSFHTEKRKFRHAHSLHARHC